MSNGRTYRPETDLQHLGEDVHYAGAVTPPIFQTSLFVFDSVEHFEEGRQNRPEGPYVYSRVNNPTLHQAEQKIAMLEKTERAKLFSSGMAAISAGIMSAVKTGDHIVAVDTCYGPTRQFLSEYLPKFGITVDYVIGKDPEDFERATKPNTTLYYLESPGSLIFNLQDLTAVAGIAKANGITTIIDNSYSSPWFQSPAEFGIDMVVHSATKYIAGHSDAVSGVLCCSSERMDILSHNEISLFGAALGPFPAWLILRSLRTLPIKMQAHEVTGNAMGRWLEQQKGMRQVMHVGLDSFPQKELRDRQMRGTGSLLSFIPECQDEAVIRKFINSLNVFQLGVSWGGFESLAVPLFLKPMEYEAETYVIRLFCGLENVEDLQEDIDQAIKASGLVS